MEEIPVNQSGGVNIDGSPQVQGDIVGRDQIIQNIIVVGRVLDFANVEGLLPKPSRLTNYQSVNEALNATFGGPSGQDLAKSTALAGEILSDILGSYVPKHPAAALPFRRLLVEIAPKLVRNLQRLNYWDIYREQAYLAVQRRVPSGLWGEVIWLRALKSLWMKYRMPDDRLYGIAELQHPLTGLLRKRRHTNALHSFKDFETFASFVVKRGTSIKVAYDPIEEQVSIDSDFGKMEGDEFRLFLVGLVIDIIALVSNSSQDVNLWKSLTDVLVPNNLERA